jgi:Uma2 family endonuclease
MVEAMQQVASPPNLPALARITVEDFHRMSELGIYDERAELIRGLVFAPPPMSPIHRKISQYLHDHIYRLVLPGCLVWRENPLTLRDSEPIPDLAVIAGSVSDFDQRHPSTAELIVEVAVTTVDADREKAEIYAEADVKEYWIVLPVERQVEVYRQPRGGKYEAREIFTQGEIVCSVLPAIRVSLAKLFA